MIQKNGITRVKKHCNLQTSIFNNFRMDNDNYETVYVKFSFLIKTLYLRTN